MKRIRSGIPYLLLTIAALCGLSVPLWAVDDGGPYRELLRFGGRAGWDVMAIFENATTSPGWEGGVDLVLQQAVLGAESDPDLLLNFEHHGRDLAGRYRSTAAPTVRVQGEFTARGAGAAAFDGSGGILLAPSNPYALFSTGRSASRFSIEMWIYVASVREGAAILTWQGARLVDGTPHYQELRFHVENRRMVWRLQNLFLPSVGTPVVELRSQQAVLPRTWQHHRLEFDGRTARVAYSIDGVVEAVRYLTADGREDGRAVSLLLGEDTSGGVFLAPDFRGAIDEVRFHVDDVAPALNRDRYSGERGTLISFPIDTSQPGTRISRIDTRALTAGGTAVRMEYRVGEQLASLDPQTALRSPWREVPADGRLERDAYGRFLQLRTHLLADSSRNRTPRLQEITVTLERKPAPPPPAAFELTPVPGGVHVRWNKVPAADVAGYLLHIGRRPGNYSGDHGVVSPIDVGTATEYTVRGLTPDVAYVFALESYDQFHRSGGLSAERHARAGRLGP